MKHKSILLKRELLTMYIAGFLINSTLVSSFIIVPLYVSEMGGSNFAIGVQAALFTIFSVLFRFLLSSLADTKGRKLSLLIGSIVFTTTPLAIYYSPSLVVMAFVRIYQAIGMATYLSAATSYVVDHTPIYLRGTSIGMYHTAATLSGVIAPAVGMALINQYGFWAFFFFLTIMGSLGTILILSLPEKLGVRYEFLSSRGDDVSNTEIHEDTISVKNIFTLFRIPELKNTYLMIFVHSMAGGILITFLTGYASSFEAITNPALYYTLRDGVGAVGAFMLGYLSDRFGRDRLLNPVLVSFALGTGILVFMDKSPLFIYFLSAAISGFGVSGAMGLLIAKVADCVPEKLRASALAFQESAIDGGNSIGVFIFGTSRMIYSFSTLISVTALVILLIPIVNIISVRKQSYPKSTSGIVQ